MKHIIALASKTALTLALLYVILDRVYHASFLSVLFIAFFLSFVTYLSGDILILPRTSNVTASLADFGLSLVILWVFLETQTRNGFSPFAAALIASVCLTVFEYFFHRYLLKNVLDETFRNELTAKDNTLQYQTEASDELFPETPDQKDEK
ncbi:YndM family protein [Bacillus mojavensis]|uniref:YndM family protein n=1 Tax=Bacillus mojavensis TaxID=72360 RepID=A0AAP3G0N5_BACMO|nr:YndM family protein [Bacillus mojavensis]MCY8480815.1 YndM family protein [Bacillus mojavensis]MCY8511765.1 YndM family protein [Bacillus mojavensis]MEC1777685.1 YndM family protein [Bacillus mojavensis]